MCRYPLLRVLILEMEGSTADGIVIEEMSLCKKKQQNKMDRYIIGAEKLRERYIDGEFT